MTLFEETGGRWLKYAIIAAVVLLAAFLFVETIGEVMSWRYIGAGIQATDTISVTGHGQYLAVPDIATFTFSVVSDEPTVAQAQTNATALANTETSYLTSQGISSNDIQTTDYSIEPQYEYQNAVCPQPLSAGSEAIPYCPPQKQILTGYEVSQTTTVKVRDISKAGTLLAGVGSRGATEVSGLTFTFDNPDAPLEQARDLAIADAQSKAQSLAQALGVTLVRIVSFEESPSGTPQPVVYSMAAGASAAPAPQISAGQNTVTDDVTITYEIR